jgi:hypothetical protein
MKRLLAATTAMLVMTLNPEALAQPVSSLQYPNTQAADKYSAFWHKAHHQCGRCAGRNIRRWGMRYSSGRVARASWRQIVRSTGQLQRLTAPPPRPRALLRRVAAPPSQPPAGVSSSAVRANLPDCTWRPESGGDYGAYNPSSGAYGKYQEQCAARVYAAQGAGAWVGC